MIRWSETTAVFGGSFDPPHLGHREAVRGLFKDPGVARVLIIPAATPPHKPTATPSAQRLAMVRLNFASVPKAPYPPEVQIDEREIERARLNPDRPSYSFDTLSDLRRNFSSLACVIGTDQLEQLSTWHRFPEVLDLCHWIVLLRKPDGEARTLRAIAQLEASGVIKKDGDSWRIRHGSSVLKLVPTEAPAISSTKIREQIATTGAPAEGTLLPEVVTYLKQSKLYGTKGHV